MRCAPILTAVFVSTLFAATIAQAGERTRERVPAAPETTAAEAGPAVSSGLRVYVDPETGRLTSTPTDEQRRAFAELDARNSAALNGQTRFTQERLASGADLLHTNGGNQSVVLAKPGRRGGVEIGCTDPLHAHIQNAAAASPEADDER